MNFAQSGVYDVLLFNEEDKLIAEFNTLKSSLLSYEESLETYVLVVKDALLNVDYLRFIGKESKLSDYERMLKKQSTVISITKNYNKNCKLIAKVPVRDEEHIDKQMIIEMSKAQIISNVNLEGSNDLISEFDAVFKIIPNGDEFFKLHI